MSSISSEFLLQELNKKVYKADVDNLTKSRIWLSTNISEINNNIFQPESDKMMTIDHNLSLSEEEIITSKCEIKLRCIISEYGYNIGDYAMNWGISSGTTVLAPIPHLSTNSIQFFCGNENIKFTGKGPYQGLKTITPENWRLVFIIRY